MRRGVKTIIAGVVLLLAAIIVVPLGVLLVIGLGAHKSWVFKVPDTVMLKVEKPGQYILWDDFKVDYQGKSYNLSDSLPGTMRIQILDEAGHSIRFMPDTAFSMRVVGHAHRSVGYVIVTQPGKFSIEVSGMNEERIFSFKRANPMEGALLIAGGVGMALVLGLAGVVFVIWGIVKLAKGTKSGGQMA